MPQEQRELSAPTATPQMGLWWTIVHIIARIVFSPPIGPRQHPQQGTSRVLAVYGECPKLEKSAL